VSLERIVVGRKGQYAAFQRLCGRVTSSVRVKLVSAAEVTPDCVLAYFTVPARLDFEVVVLTQTLQGHDIVRREVQAV
jgi:hypothetical protein